MESCTTNCILAHNHFRESQTQESYQLCSSAYLYWRIHWMHQHLYQYEEWVLCCEATQYARLLPFLHRH